MNLLKALAIFLSLGCSEPLSPTEIDNVNDNAKLYMSDFGIPSEVARIYCRTERGNNSDKAKCMITKANGMVIEILCPFRIRVVSTENSDGKIGCESAKF